MDRRSGAKVEFADQKGTMFKPGSYLLTKDAGRTLYLVDPKEKAYSRWDLEAMLATTFALIEGTGPLLDLEFSNASSKKLGEDDGGTLLGYPTRHYQWQSAHDMKLSVLGMKRQYHIESVQDFWSTDQLGAEGFKVWLRPDRTRTGNSGLDELLTSEMATVRASRSRGDQVHDDDRQGQAAEVEFDHGGHHLAPGIGARATFDLPAGLRGAALPPGDASAAAVVDVAAHCRSRHRSTPVSSIAGSSSQCRAIQRRVSAVSWRPPRSPSDRNSHPSRSLADPLLRRAVAQRVPARACSRPVAPPAA